MTKKRIALIILTLIFLTWTVASVIHDVNNDRMLQSQNVERMPAGYIKTASEQGSLQVISYKTTMLGTDEKPEGRTITKKATVYLPYNYDPHKKYDVMYIIHGRGGNYETWLGTKDKVKPFKNVMDHMIEDGLTPAMIVVAPGINYQYKTDNMRMAGISHEIAYELMPAVESRFSTYASRNHRIACGFSMGGSATWHLMKNHIDKFRYFIPMSMAMYYDSKGYSKRKSIRASENIINSIKAKGYGRNDFEVYAVTGTEDHKADAAAMQVFDLTASQRFRYTDAGFGRGNVAFKLWPDKWHSYKESFPYIYNALAEFYDN